MIDVPTGGMWPTATDLVLLRATVNPGSATDPIWDQLRAMYPSATEIVAKHPRLAPLFHYRLRQADIDWPDMDALAGTARRVWGANQMRIFRAADVQRVLEDAGIETIFLKGVALLPLYPAETTRPMQDIDVLVRQSDFDRALTVLSSNGWTAHFSNTDITRRWGHAGLLMSDDGQELDLHWRLAPGAFSSNQTADPWETSRVIPMAGRSIRVLGPAYQLYHTISHGLAWAKDPSLQWIPDAVFAIESAGEAIDWDRFLKLADANNRGVAIREGLALLANRLGAAIPDRILAPAPAPSPAERREAWFLRHVGPRSLLGGVPDRWYLYRRTALSIGENPTPWGYWRYLRWRWDPHGSLSSTVKAKIADRISAARRTS